MRYSRRRAPVDDAHPLVKIRQYTSDFNAFRDDAHMAAFQPLGVSGHGWEAFSFVWQETANTVEAINQQLFYRGYSAAEFGAELDKLVAKGWLVKDGDVYGVTETGRSVRTQAETDTNTYFYAPWAVLNDAEVDEVNELMTGLQAKLQGLS